MKHYMYEFYSFEIDDGGRMRAGFKGTARDCATRAIAIALELPYRQIHRELTELQKSSRFEPTRKTWKSACDGINISFREFHNYLNQYGLYPIYPPNGKHLQTVLGTLKQLAEEPLLIAFVTNHAVAIKKWCNL